QTVFAPPLAGSDDEDAPSTPQVRPDAKTELLRGGSQLPRTKISPALSGADGEVSGQSGAGGSAGLPAGPPAPPLPSPPPLPPAPPAMPPAPPAPAVPPAGLRDLPPPTGPPYAAVPPPPGGL